MSRPILALAALSAALACPLASAGGEPPQDQAAPMSMPAAQPAADDQALIRSAMQAAPAKVAAGATIVAMAADGSMRTVRAGSNGFTCMADNPETPGPDPMCMDAAAMDWVGAWVGHKAPASGKIGLMYMLAGGTDASNTDPHATKPEAGNHWIETGPHVMIVGADPAFYAMYPSTADPDTTAPYVMFPGTPYQHLMIPVE
ncbi:hypothetical protein [Cognatiluteimonas weifangensis]|uniref:Uncharacterized protein n=1 Tax=Cognatiluteimonas weifangensis TaxID=2303539 RepID=A0A372DQM7_9GAMM|nr:hypothetical protein [Luteimonas weifangensis]RFP61846.1 hypothetical protein D0Y53_01940 [Luteimonas weifangensis]